MRESDPRNLAPNGLFWPVVGREVVDFSTSFPPSFNPFPFTRSHFPFVRMPSGRRRGQRVSRGIGAHILSGHWPTHPSGGLAPSAAVGRQTNPLGTEAFQLSPSSQQVAPGPGPAHDSVTLSNPHLGKTRDTTSSPTESTSSEFGPSFLVEGPNRSAGPGQEKRQSVTPPPPHGTSGLTSSADLSERHSSPIYAYSSQESGLSSGDTPELSSSPLLGGTDPAPIRSTVLDNLSRCVRLGPRPVPSDLLDQLALPPLPSSTLPSESDDQGSSHYANTLDVDQKRQDAVFAAYAGLREVAAVLQGQSRELSWSLSRLEARAGQATDIRARLSTNRAALLAPEHIACSTTTTVDLQRTAELRTLIPDLDLDPAGQVMWPWTTAGDTPLVARQLQTASLSSELLGGPSPCSVLDSEPSAKKGTLIGISSLGKEPSAPILPQLTCNGSDGQPVLHGAPYHYPVTCLTSLVRMLNTPSPSSDDFEIPFSTFSSSLLRKVLAVAESDPVDRLGRVAHLAIRSLPEVAECSRDLLGHPPQLAQYAQEAQTSRRQLGLLWPASLDVSRLLDTLGRVLIQVCPVGQVDPDANRTVADQLFPILQAHFRGACLASALSVRFDPAVRAHRHPLVPVPVSIPTSFTSSHESIPNLLRSAGKSVPSEASEPVEHSLFQLYDGGELRTDERAAWLSAAVGTQFRALVQGFQFARSLLTVAHIAQGTAELSVASPSLQTHGPSRLTIPPPVDAVGAVLGARLLCVVVSVLLRTLLPLLTVFSQQSTIPWVTWHLFSGFIEVAEVCAWIWQLSEVADALLLTPERMKGRGSDPGASDPSHDRSCTRMLRVGAADALVAGVVACWQSARDAHGERATSEGPAKTQSTAMFGSPWRSLACLRSAGVVALAVAQVYLGPGTGQQRAPTSSEECYHPDLISAKLDFERIGVDTLVVLLVDPGRPGPAGLLGSLCAGLRAGLEINVVGGVLRGLSLALGAWPQHLVTRALLHPRVSSLWRDLITLIPVFWRTRLGLFVPSSADSTLGFT